MKTNLQYSPYQMRPPATGYSLEYARWLFVIDFTNGRRIREAMTRYNFNIPEFRLYCLALKQADWLWRKRRGSLISGGFIAPERIDTLFSIFLKSCVMNGYCTEIKSTLKNNSR